MNTKTPLTLVKRQLADIHPYEKNPRKNDAAVDAVVKSIRQCGYIAPIIVDEDGVILAGHTRYKALKKLGKTEVECIVREGLTEEQKKKYRLLDNKTNELADWDMEMLAGELADLDFGDLDLDWGIDLEEEQHEVIEDDVPEVNEEAEPVTKLGDVWQLGRHRLMCGDSTNKANIMRLLDGERVDMIFTDPPYNVAFNGRSGKFDVIKNDNLSNAEFSTFIEGTIEAIKSVNAPIYYIWCNWAFYGLLQERLDYKACIVWAKNVFGMGKGYRHQHEFCLFNGNIDESIKNETDLWQIKKDHKYVHPTQKPVELSYRAIGNHSGVQTCLDLFGGSGSTMIGCEQRGVRCFTMELDPKYFDVIVKRWETFTGEKAVLLDG